MKRPAKRLWLVAAAALWPAITLATDMTPSAIVRPAPAPPAASIFVPPEPACLEWTDGCRVCQKPPTGEVACSNVGPACLPQAPRCTRR
jgi:hypothetical protein